MIKLFHCLSGSQSCKELESLQLFLCFFIYFYFYYRTGKFLGVSISLILINLAAIMERADENLLPSVYKEVSEAFNAGPSDLGYLTFVRNFVQGLASPLAGVLVITYDRPIVLAIGTLCWALSTAAVGASNYFIQVNLFFKDSDKVLFNGSLKLYKGFV